MISLAFRMAVAAGLAAVCLTGAIAQPSTVRLHGTLQSAAGASLTLGMPDGSMAEVATSQETRITGVRLASMSDIRPGVYVGAAALPGVDGTLRALEVHIFPESMRGAGEGHRPMNAAEGQTMTNGTVGVVSGTSSLGLTLSYPGGEQRISIRPDTPVVALVPGDGSILKPGARIIVTAHENSDHRFLADRILVGLDGLDPPL